MSEESKTWWLRRIWPWSWRVVLAMPLVPLAILRIGVAVHPGFTKYGQVPLTDLTVGAGRSYLAVFVRSERVAHPTCEHHVRTNEDGMRVESYEMVVGPSEVAEMIQCLFLDVDDMGWQAYEWLDGVAFHGLKLQLDYIVAAGALLAMPLLMHSTSWSRKRRRRATNRCVVCGYCLYGLSRPNCPECGTPIGQCGSITEHLAGPDSKADYGAIH